jgi:hypothetical protein
MTLLDEVGHFGGAEEIIEQFIQAAGVVPPTPRTLTSEEEDDEMAKNVAKQAATAATKASKAPATKGAKGKAATAAKAPKAAAPVQAEANGRGRKSDLAGKRLFAKVETNPRRENSFGHRSMAVVIAAGARGITVEDYVAKGGRLTDARWDLEHGHIEAKD